MYDLDRYLLIAWQKERDLKKARTQAQEAETLFNHGLGLRQYTTPPPDTTRHTKPDPTAQQAIANTRRKGNPRHVPKS